MVMDLGTLQCTPVIKKDTKLLTLTQFGIKAVYMYHLSSNCNEIIDPYIFPYASATYCIPETM